MVDNLGWITDGLLRASAFLAATWIIAALLLRQLRIRSVWIQSVTWLAVLVQGILIVPITVEVTQTSPVTATVSDRSMESSVVAELTLRRTDVSGSPPPPLSRPAHSDDLTAAATERLTPILNTTMPFVRPIAFTIWLTGACTCVVVMMQNYRRFLKTIPPEIPYPAEWHQQWLRLQADFGAQSVRLTVTSGPGPALVRVSSGYRLLVPFDQWELLCPVQRETVLRHELEHWKRGDLWRFLAWRLIASVQWFNPFAWLAVRRLEECAEWECDDAVRRACQESTTGYLHALLEFSTGLKVVPATVPAVSGHSLVRRVQRLVSTDFTEDSKMKKCTMLCLAVACVAANAITVQSVADERATRVADVRQSETTSADSDVATEAAANEAAEKETTVTFTDADSIHFLPAPAAPTIGAKLNLDVTLNGTDEILLTRLSGNKPTEAVIDMGYVFKQDPWYSAAVSKLQMEIAKADKEMKQEVQRLEELNVSAQKADGEERTRLNAELREASAALEAKQRALREQLRRQEMEALRSSFQRTRKQIADYASEEGILLVRRATRQNEKGRMLESDNPQDVIAAINQDVVYVADDCPDISEIIIERLKRQFEAESAAE
ncbi:MAG: OmpH family outer membrane protein [Planctomycetaceae bacterium]|nr:OmpH family outer membrane protein [Planctomycetaceae bacterium]